MTMSVNSTNALGASPSAATTSRSTASTASNAGSAASAAAASFSEGDFLKLLMAQMSNQDPLQPTDSTAFVTQLATFSQVEQSVQQSSQLTTMSSQLTALNNMNATGLVGHSVTLQNTSMQWSGSLATNATVGLAGAAQSVSVAVLDANGNTVRTMAMGPQPAGALQITWDGRQDSGQPAPNGTYTVNVSATGANGQSVGVSQTVSGVVSQVSFNQGSPSVTLTNGAAAPLSQLTNVSGTTSGTAAGSSTNQ